MLNLTQALAATLNPDQKIRLQAEQFVDFAKKQPGYANALLKISSESSIDQNISLAAAVQLGTLVETHWKFRDETHANKIVVDGFQYIILSEQQDK